MRLRAGRLRANQTGPGSGSSIAPTSLVEALHNWRRRPVISGGGGALITTRAHTQTRESSNWGAHKLERPMDYERDG